VPQRKRGSQTDRRVNIDLRQGQRDIAARLILRRNHIVSDVRSRVEAIWGDNRVADPEYLKNIPIAVSATIDFVIAAIERSNDIALPVPPVLLTQARLAARNGVSLDIVHRRCLVSSSLFSRHLIEATQGDGILEKDSMIRVSEIQGAAFERLLTVVDEEYSREINALVSSPERRRAKIVTRLLAGEYVDPSDLPYDLHHHHIGVITRGTGARQVLKGFAEALGCRLFVVSPDSSVIWAWLGRRKKPDVSELDRLISAQWPTAMPIAIGEPGAGADGWRNTHWQADAAFWIAVREPGSPIRYAENATISSIARDPLLVRSISQMYLEPLMNDSDGGLRLKATLRAYIAADRNASSAAVALKVSRQTVLNRLSTVEHRIGRQLMGCMTEVEAALRLEELGHTPGSRLRTEQLDNV